MKSLSRDFFQALRKKISIYNTVFGNNTNELQEDVPWPVSVATLAVTEGRRGRLGGEWAGAGAAPAVKTEPPFATNKANFLDA